MKTFFVSDTHFYHKNVLDFCDRPYETLEEMHEGMIEAWNNVVSEEDEVYHVGDVSFKGSERTLEIMKRLNGKITIIQGNHDKNSVMNRLVREGVVERVEEVGIVLNRDGQSVWISHYPMEIGNRPNKWSVHGHIHDKVSTEINQINVGVDAWEWKFKRFGEPVELGELFDLMERLHPLVVEAKQVEREKREESLDKTQKAEERMSKLEGMAKLEKIMYGKGK